MELAARPTPTAPEAPVPPIPAETTDEPFNAGPVNIGALDRNELRYLAEMVLLSQSMPHDMDLDSKTLPGVTIALKLFNALGAGIRIQAQDGQIL